MSDDVGPASRRRRSNLPRPWSSCSALRGLPDSRRRGGQFDWKGRRVVELSAVDAAIDAPRAPAGVMSPEWEPRALKNGADLRRFTDDDEAAPRALEDTDD